MNKTRYATGAIWSQGEFITFKSWLTSQLRGSETPVIVVFTKKDGTERRMRCTLNSMLLPKVEIIESDFNKLAHKNTLKHSDSAQRVYDLDIMQWRSFSWNSVKYVEYKEEVLSF